MDRSHAGGQLARLHAVQTGQGVDHGLLAAHQLSRTGVCPEFTLAAVRSHDDAGGNAQDDVEKQIAMLMSNTIRTNVIVIAHGTYMDLPDGTKKIFPQGVGQKLSPKIPQYFPNYVRYKNKSGKRTIQLESDAMIDLASTRPNALNKELPIETGLADFFAALRDTPVQEKPKSVTLIRKA